MRAEETLVSKIASSNVEEFAKLLLRPTNEEEDVLRMVLGDERYQRMHGAVLRNNIARTRKTDATPLERGNVVVLHGIMGAHLTTVDREGTEEHVWMRLLSILRGRFLRFALEANGLSEVDQKYDVRPSGIMKRYYGDLLLAIAENWNVRAFWYDWRKDLDLAAAALQAQIEGWFGPRAPVHLVAHSMGGLVARSFIKRYQGRWDSMWDQGTASRKEGTLGGRLIMLGTPNHGSYDMVQAIAGIEGTVHKLCLIDFLHRTELLHTLNSFVGAYQMLPSPEKDNHPLYLAETYQNADVIQMRLDNAKRHHDDLRAVIDTKRMLYVAGYNQPTADGITDISNLGSMRSYSYSLNGDGRVSHRLGLLDGVPTFYVEERHGDLPGNSSVLNAIDELLLTGDTNTLSKCALGTRTSYSSDGLRETIERETKEEEQELLGLAEQVRSREVVGDMPPYSSEERRIEDLMIRGLLGYRTEGKRRTVHIEPQLTPIRLTIELFNGRLETDFPRDGSPNGLPPVDAVAVGHYIGVRPERAELDLDQEISSAVVGDGKILERESLLLTRFIDRGLIRGDLGQPFLLSDPRWPQRLIVIAGMGMPGRFGVPELAVLARELCWCLGRLGKRHLACVLIGSGARNLRVEDAVPAWLRGIKNALAESTDNLTKSLSAITFCELDPDKFKKIEHEVNEEAKRLNAEAPTAMIVEVKPAPKASVETQKSRLYGLDSKQDWEETPMRINLGLDERGHYHFGAITEDASVPEREIVVDSRIILDANDGLVRAADLYAQFEEGRFLEQFLLPTDFRDKLMGNKPIVMLLDKGTARIHWEMLAQPGTGKFDEQRLLEGKQINDPEQFFLAIGRGFTRQLRTSFSGPPEPPPPPKRTLRVLVVADPARDAHLPGAEEEGVMVADLFESFNSVYRGRTESVVEVKRLLGPRQASRVNVLRELMLRSYDVLHFAGHCIYDSDDPTSSGWVFNIKTNERLTARELTRIDRIPKFVFSNACESGVMRDKPEARTAELAPGFAESFFFRGVANFVCTAWPVSDVAAREFASRLYQGLLDIRSKEIDKGALAGMSSDGIPKFEPMHIAMREARRELALRKYGIRTWGAYQHYGNPYFRLFEPGSVVAQKATDVPTKQAVSITAQRAA